MIFILYCLHILVLYQAMSYMDVFNFLIFRVSANKRAGEDRDDDPGWPSCHRRL